MTDDVPVTKRLRSSRAAEPEPESAERQLSRQSESRRRGKAEKEVEKEGDDEEGEEDEEEVGEEGGGKRQSKATHAAPARSTKSAHPGDRSQKKRRR